MKTKDAIVIGFIVIISFIIGFKTSDYIYQTPEPKSESPSVVYLYPERCIDCEKHIPPTCEDCNTYYRNPNVLKALGEDLGVTLKPYLSDAVYEPNVLITYENRASLGSAKNKLSMATVLCTAMKVEKSCNLLESSLSDVENCVSKYNVTKDTILYHYDPGCEKCEDTNPYVRELENLTYDNENYKVIWINHDNLEQMKILRECASGYMSIDYIPQVFCPANARSKTGKMSLSELRDFADDCIDASV